MFKIEMKNIILFLLILFSLIYSKCNSAVLTSNVALLNGKLPINGKNNGHRMLAKGKMRILNKSAGTLPLGQNTIKIDGKLEKTISKSMLPKIISKNSFKLKKSEEEKFLDSKADLVIENGKEIYEKLVEPFLPFVEGNEDWSENPIIYDEDLKEYLKKLLESTKNAAQNVLNFCKKPIEQPICLKWWHSYRQKWTTFVNIESTEIRMNYVQWLKQWTWNLDLLSWSIDNPSGAFDWPFTKIHFHNIQREFENSNNSLENKENWQQSQKHSFPVKLHYNKFFEQNEYPEDLYHAEIEVHGVLFSFGNNYGIFNYSKEEKAENIEADNKNLNKKPGDPKEKKIEEIELGETHFTAGEVQEIIDQLGSTQFAPGKYKLSENNCQHFAGQFADILLGRHPLEKWPAFIHSDRHLRVSIPRWNCSKRR